MAAPETVSFPVFGDLHLGYDEESWENAAGALRDAIALGPDFLLCTGDVIGSGPGGWSLVERLRNINPGLACRVSRGHADVAAGGDSVWERAVGQPVRSVLDIGHVRVLTLGAVSQGCQPSVGPGAADWLRATAAVRPRAVVVVLSHAPIKDTTFWSCDNSESDCLGYLLEPGPSPTHLYLPESAAIARALEESPNVALFISGHVHGDHHLVCDHGYGGLCVRSGVVHMAAANLGGWRGIGEDRQEYRWVDIDRTSLRVRTRDFVEATWIDEMERTFPLRAR